MSQKSVYLATQYLNFVRERGKWFSIHDEDPGGTGAHEINIKRCPISLSAPQPGGFVENLEYVVTERPTAQHDGKKVKYVGVWDSQNGGNFLFRAKCVDPITLSHGVPLDFTKGGLKYYESVAS